MGLSIASSPGLPLQEDVCTPQPAPGAPRLIHARLPEGCRQIDADPQQGCPLLFLGLGSSARSSCFIEGFLVSVLCLFQQRSICSILIPSHTLRAEGGSRQRGVVTVQLLEGSPPGGVFRAQAAQGSAGLALWAE